ncbi:MAG: hypothetical protein ACOZE5_10000 [Verrucomicrobiota bacterium]
MTIFAMAVAQDTHQGRSDQTPVRGDLQQQTKLAIDSFAYAEDRDEHHRQIKASIAANGPEILSVLQNIFQQADDDEYRKAVLETMFLVKGGDDRILSFLAAEFKSDVSRNGRAWVFLALKYLTEKHPDKVAEFAVNALQFEDDKFIKPQALGILERHGDESVLPALQKFLSERSLIVGKDFAGDSLIVMAEIALRRIKERAAMNRHQAMDLLGAPKDAVGHTQPQVIDTDIARADEAPEGGMSRDHSIISAKTLWGIATAFVLVALVMVWLKRR